MNKSSTEVTTTAIIAAAADFTIYVCDNNSDIECGGGGGYAFFVPFRV